MLEWEMSIDHFGVPQIDCRNDILREVGRIRSPSMQSLATQTLEALREAEATVAATVQPSGPAARSAGDGGALITPGEAFGSQLVS
jgi:hypothetical protein